MEQTAEYINLNFYCQNGTQLIYVNCDFLCLLCSNQRWQLYWTKLSKPVKLGHSSPVFLHSDRYNGPNYGNKTHVIKKTLSISWTSQLNNSVCKVFHMSLYRWNINLCVSAVVIIAILIITVSAVHIDVWGLDYCPVWPLKKRLTWKYAWNEVQQNLPLSPACLCGKVGVGSIS